MGNMRKALENIVWNFETDFVLDGVIVDNPDPLLVKNYQAAKAALEGNYAAILSEWRPEDMTAATAPEWLKELAPEEYAIRRNDENKSAVHSLGVQKDWLKIAASMLHSQGVFSGSEFGSFGHQCFIVANALSATRDKIIEALGLENNEA